MISLASLTDVTLNDAAKIEQIRLLIVEAIDDLEQVARSRALTNMVWEVNSNNRGQNWSQTSVLLESYENNRDRSLESALSTLRELAGIIEKETFVAPSSGDINENTNLELTGIDENLDLELATINALSAVPD